MLGTFIVYVALLCVSNMLYIVLLQVNPQQSAYFKESISRGCTPNNAYPFSYRPHYAQHVDPSTGNVTKIIVIPAAMVNAIQAQLYIYIYIYNCSFSFNIANHPFA